MRSRPASSTSCCRCKTCRQRSASISRGCATWIGPGHRPTSTTRAPLRDILMLLKVRTGNDFSSYKPATLFRRIHRRMSCRRGDEPVELRGVAARAARGGGHADEGAAHQRDAFLQRPGGIRAARTAPDSATLRIEDARRSGTGLGARLRHGRGGLFDRDAPRGACRLASRSAAGAGVCHRSRRGRDRHGARRTLQRRRDERRPRSARSRAFSTARLPATASDANCASSSCSPTTTWSKIRPSRTSISCRAETCSFT